MRKALRRIAHLERLDSTAAEGAISAVLETSHGDMRHAVNSLQFMTTGVQHTTAAAARGKQGRKRRRRSSRDAGDGARVSNQAATSRLRALVASCGHDRFRNPMHSIGKLLTGKRTLVWRAVRATPWCLWVTSAWVGLCAGRDGELDYQPEDVIDDCSLGVGGCLSFIAVRCLCHGCCRNEGVLTLSCGAVDHTGELRRSIHTD